MKFLNLLILLALMSCAHKQEENRPDEETNFPTTGSARNETPADPSVTIEKPANVITWKVPKPMSRYQILKEDDGLYTKQLKAGVGVVTIEGLSEGEGKESAKEQIKQLKDKKKDLIVICYHSLSYEPWRKDIGQFPKAAKGKKMSGWNEWWSDTRPSSPAHVFWDKRYDLFASIGCDCVEDDNEVDSGDNETGFPLTFAQAAESNAKRARAAHDRGMCHVAKNNPGMSSSYSRFSDAVYIEEAAKYGEREDYLPWKKAGKFAAMIEYNSSGCKPYSGFSVQYHSDGDYFSGINLKECDK